MACLDFVTILLLPLIWACLITSSLVLLGFTTLSTHRHYITPDGVAFALGMDILPLLFTAILNDLLVARVWRCVVYLAINTSEYATNRQLGDNLYAANLELLVFWRRNLKHLVRRPLQFICRRKFQCLEYGASRQEWKCFLSYILLRMGTAVGIATVQLAVSFTPAGAEDAVNRRVSFLFIPVAVHALSVFGAVIIWGHFWILFSGRYSGEGLHNAFRVYLYRGEGSLASYAQIAKQFYRGHIIHPYAAGAGQVEAVEVPIKSGLQMWPKLKGLSFPLIVMWAPPALVWTLLKSKHTMSIGWMRFINSFAFLTLYIFFAMAHDFVSWNINLDSLSVVPHAKPRRSLHHLGDLSGTMLLVRSFENCLSPRPWRATISSWIFWLQACGMRLQVSFFAFCMTALSYSEEDTAEILDPDFWPGWALITGVLTLPLFFTWMFVKVDPPVGGVDWWRWANIMEDASIRRGRYGSVIHPNGSRRAGFDEKAEAFGAHFGEPSR